MITIFDQHGSVEKNGLVMHEKNDVKLGTMKDSFQNTDRSFHQDCSD